MFRPHAAKPAVLALLFGTALGGCVAQQPDVYYVPYGPRYAQPAPRYQVIEVEPRYRPRRPVVYAEPVERVRPAPRPRPVPAEMRRPPVARGIDAQPVQVGVDPAGREGRGGGAGGAGGGGGWSDIRLKTNIEPVGTAANGLTLYAFDYVWGGERMVGVMAQDVLRTNPAAVIMTGSGYMKVDYSRLGMAMMPYAKWLSP